MTTASGSTSLQDFTFGRARVQGRAVSRTIATISRPADATAYATGDAIANSATPASVLPLTFTLAMPQGRLMGAQCVVTPASGNLVIVALDFDLLLFRPNTGIPFAAGSYPGDNLALNVSAAAMRELVGVFAFANGAWRNPAGALTAGVCGVQAVAPAARAAYLFDVADQSTQTLIGVLQAKGAWTPGAVVNQFDIALDVDLD